MRRALLVVAAVLVALLLVVEVAAVPVTTRVLAGFLTRCGFGYETVEVTSVGRPLVPRLLLGRARDVEVHATGLTAGDLRVVDARLRVPDAVLPWAPFPPDAAPVDLDVVVTEDDLEQAARERAPLGIPVTVDLAAGSGDGAGTESGDVIGVVEVGADGVPLTVEVAVELDDDGTVRLRPVAGDAGLLDRLGVAAEIPPADLARVTALAITDGQVAGTIRITVVPGAADEPLCEEPIV